MHKNALAISLLLLFPCLNGCSKASDNSAKGVPQTGNSTVAPLSQASADSNSPEPTADTPTADDLVLHGLKFGVPLDSQMPKCRTRVEGENRLVLGTGLCYLDDTLEPVGNLDSKIDVAQGGQSLPVDKSSDDFNLRITMALSLVPPAMKEHGNVAEIDSHYSEERLGEIKEKISAEYGSPADGGKDFPSWHTQWGLINGASAFGYFYLTAYTADFYEASVQSTEKEMQKSLSDTPDPSTDPKQPKSSYVGEWVGTVYEVAATSGGEAAGDTTYDLTFSFPSPDDPETFNNPEITVKQVAETTGGDVTDDAAYDLGKQRILLGVPAANGQPGYIFLPGTNPLSGTGGTLVWWVRQNESDGGISINVYEKEGMRPIEVGTLLKKKHLITPLNSSFDNLAKQDSQNICEGARKLARDAQ